MLCDKCGTEINENEAFCANCGASVHTTPEMATPLPVNAVELEQDVADLRASADELREDATYYEPQADLVQTDMPPADVGQYTPAPSAQEPNAYVPYPSAVQKSVRKPVAPVVVGILFILFSLAFGVVYAVPLAMYVPTNLLVGVANVVAVVAAGILLVTAIVLITGRVGVAGAVLASCIANIALGMHAAAAMVYGIEINITNFGGMWQGTVLHMWPLALEAVFSFIVLICAGILVHARRKRERIQ